MNKAIVAKKPVEADQTEFVSKITPQNVHKAIIYVVLSQQLCAWRVVFLHQCRHRLL